MKVLVTGSSGFIGSHLVSRLSALGWEVTALDIKEIASPKYTFHRIDIRDKEKLERIFRRQKFATIIHLAAKGGVRQSFIEPALFSETNIAGTSNLLVLSEKYEVKKFIFASSSSVYGDKQPPFREDEPFGKLLSPYALSKRAGEDLCRVYHEKTGIKVTVLRFFTVYGPAGRPDMAPYLFTKAIMENRSITRFGRGDTTRDFTYIDDIVDGIVAALKADLDFEIINLGSGRAESLNDLIKIIEEITGKKARISQKERNPADMKATLADISKAQRLLNYRPKKSLEEGIDIFIDWYLKNRLS